MQATRRLSVSVRVGRVVASPEDARRLLLIAATSADTVALPNRRAEVPSKATGDAPQRLWVSKCREIVRRVGARPHNHTVRESFR